MFQNLMKGLTGNSKSEKEAHRHHRHASSRKAAPIVKEKVVQHEIEEVQPVVERTVQQAEVNQVIQPVIDHQSTTVHHEESASLPVETKVSKDESSDAVLEKYNPNYADVQPEHIVEKAGDVETIIKEPIVTEKVEKHVVTEVQPVVEREINETHVHHVTKPVEEYHAAAPIVHTAVHKAPISIEEFKQQSNEEQL